MLKQLLVSFLFCSFFGAFTAQAQSVVVNSPSDIAGFYTFSDSWEAGSWGVDLNTGVWTADIVLVDDGVVDPGTNSDGCSDLMNGADIAGKIAIIDRGECAFVLKAMNAQAVGAIAVVILNNNPDTGLPPLGGSTTEVTIPVVGLSLADGDIIKAAMANGAVNMTIGDIGIPNNIGADPVTGILRAPVGRMPAAQADALMQPFLLGANIVNNGLNDASNIIVEAAIDFTPAGGGASTNVYNEVGTIAALMVDSSEIVGLAEYTPASGAGAYDITYTITSDSTDDATADNLITSQFVLSDNSYAKGGWVEAENRPFNNQSFTINGGGNIEFMAGFNMPLGTGYQMDTVIFFVTTNAFSLGTVGAGNIAAYVYEWDDANEDGSSSNEEITIVGFGEVTAFVDSSATAETMRIPVLDFATFEEGYVVPGDDKQYFIGVRYQGDLTVFFGFDSDYDQTVLTDNVTGTTDLDLPYLGINAWDGLQPSVDDGFLFTGFRGSVNQGLLISQLVATGEVNPEIGSFEVFPSPATDFINVETNLTKNFDAIDYNIVDMKGSIISTTSRDVNGTYDNVRIDVSNLAVGQYYLNVNTVDGSLSKAFSVQR